LKVDATFKELAAPQPPAEERRKRIALPFSGIIIKERSASQGRAFFYSIDGFPTLRFDQRHRS